jgi:hypothetical protein
MAAASLRGSVRLPLRGGGIAFYARSHPTNVYVAFPDSTVQVEVYDPSAALARKVVLAGNIRQLNAPTGASSAAAIPAVGASPAALKNDAATLGRPIYWLGPIHGLTLELSQSADGRVFVRYLPPGVLVGASRPYLTVATYPLTSGFTDTRAAAQRVGAVRIPLADGAVAFYMRSRPTNVYLAFPNVREQIEVFDPSPSEARKLVAAGRVQRT